MLFIETRQMISVPEIFLLRSTVTEGLLPSVVRREVMENTEMKRSVTHPVAESGRCCT